MARILKRFKRTAELEIKLITLKAKQSKLFWKNKALIKDNQFLINQVLEVTRMKEQYLEALEASQESCEYYKNRLKELKNKENEIRSN